MEKAPRLTVIIPSHNEEQNIKECILRIPREKYDPEIIVVDDGNDKTAEIVREISSKDKKVRLIHFDEKRGKGGAVIEAIKRSTGNIIVILDADLTTPPEEIEMVVKPIFDGKADFVNASRLRYHISKESMSFTHKLGNKFFALMTSIILRVRFTDIFCGYKAFKKELGDKLTEKSWPDMELIFKAKRAKSRIVEVPVHYVPRKGGNSKVNTFKDGWRNLVMLFKYAVIKK